MKGREGMGRRVMGLAPNNFDVAPLYMFPGLVVKP
jgi:hypothetical protein